MVDMDSNDAQPVTTAVMTAFLRTGKGIDHTSSVLLLVNVLLIESRPAAIQLTAPLMALIALAGLFVALVEKYFAWRVGLDAELFAVLQRFPNETTAFDTALAGCLGRSTVPPLRSMRRRWQGARRLMQYQFFVFGLQGVFVSTIMVLHYMNAP